nr:unnamed protein product [Spirometra erinaceieuropaei]
MLSSLTLLVFLHLTTGDLGSCSRETSRLARRILSTTFSNVDIENMALPDTCPIKPSTDYFATQDAMFIKNHEYSWECGFCGKRFYEAHFLDKHFGNRHNETLVLKEHAFCLADLCPILRCDAFRPVELGELPLFWRAALCQEKYFDNFRYQCQTLIRNCPAGASAEVNREWNTTLDALLCSRLTCDAYWENPEDENLSTVTMCKIFAVCLGVTAYALAISLRILSYTSEI